jgi:predicted nucleic acid-binding protein
MAVVVDTDVVSYLFKNDRRKWAEIMVAANRKGRPMEVADAWHAATALALGVPLMTHNAADYVGVNGLSILTAP